MYMQRTASRAFRDVPTYLVYAPLRSTSLSGCGRGVRLQLQTRAVACCSRASAPATPAPHAASVLPLTTSVLCDLRYRRIIALCRRRGRGERGSARFGARPAATARSGRPAGLRDSLPEKPDGVRRVLCACGRNSDVGRKCLCGRVSMAQTPDPAVSAVPAAPAWRWTSM